MSPKEKDLVGSMVPLLAICITLYFNTWYLDPFNLPKFHLLLLSCPVLLYVSIKNWNEGWKDLKKFVALITAFVLSFSLPFVAQENRYDFFFGSYGRKIGFLTYFTCVLIAYVSAVTWKESRSTFLIVNISMLSIIEIGYGIIQYNGKDFVSWNNPYSPILGTLGNPNYISALLGTFGAVLLLFTFQSWLSIPWKVIVVLLIIVDLFLIIRSSSIQGLFTFFVALSSLIFAILHKRNKTIAYSYSVLIFISASIALAGFLQKGPLKSYLYQNSISARGDYWRAAIAMVKDFPITGVGIERFGDNFGAYRDLTQARYRGYDTYSDNAHNVFLQFFATGGVIVGTLFLAIMLYGALCAIKQLRIVPSENVVAVLAPILYLSLLVPSLISIDNLGSMVWLWMSLGIVVKRNHNLVDSSKRKA